MRRPTKLKIAIWKKGFTQREVAKKSGIDEATISLISNGKYNADPVQRAKIAVAIETPENVLFGDEDSNGNS